MKRTFGFELALDLHGCKLSRISDKEVIAEYATKICEVIDMKRYGEPRIEYFGTNKKHTKGYTLVQLIETSDITGHFSEYWKRAYINIFTCKAFSWETARDFTERFFGAKNSRAIFLIRE